MIPDHLNLVCHADWSANNPKRWQALAYRQANGSFLALAPQKVTDASNMLDSLRKKAGDKASILVGFDFPIGLPEAYAHKADIPSFLAILPELGKGDWAEFFDVAENREQVKLKRPFYPKKPGTAAQQHLLDGLGIGAFDELRRKCELPQPGRRSAAPLFWTLGAQQVGKAALSGWRYVLQPALDNQSASIWPFAGTLFDLLQPGKTVIVETYPAEFYRLISAPKNVHASPPVRSPALRQSGSKRSPERRKADGAGLLSLAHQLGVSISVELFQTIQAGFGEAPSGEDAFDAVVGLFGMLYTLQNWDGSAAPAGFEPDSPIIREIEGWIFGQRIQGQAGYLNPKMQVRFSGILYNEFNKRNFA